MSKTIDERVVSMQFDNRNFENNVKTTIGTLDRLKEKLKFPGATKSLDNISTAANKVNLSGISSAVDTVQARFSALSVVGVTALANIANQAVNTGKQLLSSFTIDPITSGFQEYETQLNSVQTILANTQHKGSTLNEVNAALDELNTYADQTIYNFTEMTRNIGTFTAAGVDLEKSVTSIKGIANLAAVSGSNAQQASTAMYQLSQALAAGKVSLMDWNSVVNAGMGGEVFQNALKRTAENFGYNVDGMIKKYGSFRESLTEGGWLTAEVLTETLTQLSGAYTEADLIAQGYTKKQAQEIVQLAETAKAAATEVKTFTQLIDTVKEAIGSGWAQTWEIIFGDFGESKELFSGISNAIGEMVSASSEARNKMLTEGLSTGWKQLLAQGIGDEEGFKESIKSVAKEHKISVDQMIKDTGSFEASLKKGWLTGDILTESLDKMTKKISGMSEKQLKAAGYTTEQVTELKKLNEAVKKGTVDMDEFAQKLKMDSGRENLIQGATNIIKTLGDAIAPIREAFRDIFPATTGDQLYAFTERFEELTEKFTISAETADKIKRTFSGLFSIFDLLGKAIKTVLTPLTSFVGSGGAGGVLDIILSITAAIGDFFTTINNSTGVGNFFSGLSSGLSTAASGFSTFINAIASGIGGFEGILSTLENGISYIAGLIGDAFTWITDNISGGDIAAGLAGGGLFLLLKKFASLIGKVKDVIENLFGKDSDVSSMVDNFSSLLEGVHDSLDAFTSGIKVASLVGIATAIGILSASLKTISEIDSENVVGSLITMGLMFTGLSLSFKSITKTLSRFNSKGVVKSSIALIGMAAALNIMANAIKKIADLEMDQIGRSLLALGVGLAELTIGMRFMGKATGSIKNAAALMILAKACDDLGEALKIFAELSWDEIGRGLTAMGGALLELSASLAILNKTGGFKSLLSSAGLFIAVQSLNDISESLKKLSELSWDDIGRGLTAMGGALLEFTVILGILSKVSGFGTILAGTGLLIAVQSLDIIAESLKKLGSLSWDEIGKGLSAMGGALLELAGISGTLGKITGFSGLLGSTSILIAVQSLDAISVSLSKLGSLSWGEIGKGLAAMGGALLELAVISGATGSLAGIAGLVGAGTITLAVQGLNQLADGLIKFGTMSWDEIGKGLASMGGALLEVSAGSALAGLTGIAGLVGAGTITLAVQGLNQLADALIKFGSMSWDEIGRGLAAMGAAMGETAIGGLINTLSGFGADAIAKIAEPLGNLADSVRKWTNVKVPDGLGNQLSALAPGIQAFTFSGWGADAIAAVADPLGVLADSVMKWTNVVVPDGLGDQLKSLAPGIGAFNFSGWGADAIAAVATPLGTLANSVKAWSTVVVPENMKEMLQGLASGVKAFNFSGWAANDISDIVQPLKDLAGAIKAWSGIVIPENMGGKLSSLASGLKAFDRSFFEGDYDISKAIGPIKDLAGAMKAWNGVTVNLAMGMGLSSFANGLNTFNAIDPSKITSACNAIRNIGQAAIDISGIDFMSIAANVNSFIKSISNLKVSTDSFKNMGTTLVNSLVNAINSSGYRAQAAGASIVSKVAAGINSGNSSLISTASSIASAITSGIDSKSSLFNSAGKKVMSAFELGIKSSQKSISSTIGSMMSSTISSIRKYYSNFKSSGSYLVSGFAAGISANTYAATAKAAAMAEAAARAAKKKLNIHSPSKVFYSIGDYAGQGFVKALSDYVDISYRSGRDMASSASDGLNAAIATIGKAFDIDTDIQPTISPVLDLSNVRSGVRSINGLFGTKQSLGVVGRVNALSGITANQNGTNNDVVGAIKDLKKIVKDLQGGGDTYTIGGITYSNGDEIAQTIRELVRIAKLEGRT